ncbi:MAG: pSer/pThr/pTyr-binding forkhead associated (FHA) protein [Polaribacter sp.]|jgi:pSer/pThr/pTyr-binding forkhead associated (FHA) protein
MLKIQFKDRRKPAMWLVEPTLKISSEMPCDILIEDPNAKGIDCELVIEHSQILLNVSSSAPTVFINEVPVLQNQVIDAWDVIRIGKDELELIDPLKERSTQPRPVESNKTVIRSAISGWMLKANTKPIMGRFYQINDGNTIGRDDEANIVVPLDYISRIHAKLSINKGLLFIEDLKSSNGTFVNDERVKKSELRNKDELRLYEFSFTVIGPDIKNETKPKTIVRKNKDVAEQIKKSITSSHPKIRLASQTVYLHDIDESSKGKIHEIINAKNHLSKLLGHHLSTSEQSVSARHVYLNQTDTGWEIVNNGASDGLLINGRMQIRAVLSDEDEVKVGGIQFKFQSSGTQPKSYFKPRKNNSKFTVPAVVIIVLIGIVGWLALA